MTTAATKRTFRWIALVSKFGRFFRVIGQEIGGETLKIAQEDRLAHVLHQLDESEYIVDGEQGTSQHFPCSDQMADIRAGEVLAGIAAAAFNYRPRISSIAGIHHIQPAGAGHRSLVPGQAGGQDAVEYIDPA